VFVQGGAEEGCEHVVWQQREARLDLHAFLLVYLSVHKRERLRRDVTCEHAALQQRALSEAPLEKAGFSAEGSG
jgi:hypothetical protein